MMESLRVFIIEDDKLYGEMLRFHLSLNPDNEVFFFRSGKECIDNLYLNPDFISLDYSLPDTSGLDILKKTQAFKPGLPVVMVSGQEDVGTARTPERTRPAPQCPCRFDRAGRKDMDRRRRRPAH